MIGLITFLAAQESLHGLKLLLTILPTVLAGCIVCYFWYALLMIYKRLLRFRFDQLEKIEAEIEDCHGMFRRESDELYRNAPPGKKIEFRK